jgi:hypothetical protein
VVSRDAGCLRRRFAHRTRTSYDLGALEVLVGVQVAGRQGKVDAHEDQQEVDSSPHDCGCMAPCGGCEEVGRRMSGAEGEGEGEGEGG